MANLLLPVMGAFVGFKRALILERQREGIAAAKQRGVYTGRNPIGTTDRGTRSTADRHPFMTTGVTSERVTHLIILRSPG